MNTFFKEYFDRTTFFACLALIGIGLLSIYSATFDTNAAINFHKQVTWAAIGFILMVATMLVPLRVIHRSSMVIFAISLFGLAAVLAVGHRAYGSLSWFGFGGMGGQPSEFVKVTTILALASFFSRSDTNMGSIKDVAKAFGIIMLPIALIMMQPDLGTSLTFLAMFVPILYWAGASNFLIVAIIAPGVVALAAIIGTTTFLIALVCVGAALYFFREDRFFSAVMFGVNAMVGIFVQVVYEKLPLYQQKRIATFIDPNNDPLGAGYNVIQAKVAIGSGGFLGKGYLQGTQTQLNFIPKQWTDFIFCVPGEEFGFLGAVIVLGLFAVILIHGVRVGYIAKNRFGSIIAIGIVSLFAVHVFVNVGMSVGLMPVIGIPLPFLSYGGSSLCSYMIMMGLLMNVYAHRKEY
ncbi:MAG TPA: rod shape-determining protein RodA [Bacteroidota bacterium]|nr:rod shape-determining protein RodA [Bacteroidota bacterium]